MSDKRKLTGPQAIKEYFRPPEVTMTELKSLSSEERRWLAAESCRMPGAEYLPPAGFGEPETKAPAGSS